MPHFAVEFRAGAGAGSGSVAVRPFLRHAGEDAEIAAGIGARVRPQDDHIAIRFSRNGTKGAVDGQAPDGTSAKHADGRLAARQLVSNAELGAADEGAADPDPPGPDDGVGPGADVGAEAPEFRNRIAELEQVVEDGLDRADGEHFWLVIAAPKLGKTWFLDKIKAKIAAQNPGQWALSSIDLRQWPDAAVLDPSVLVCQIFGQPFAAGTDLGADDLSAIAAGMLAAGQSRLCLIDGAESLDDAAVAMLRSHLAQIYQHLVMARNPDVRLALIVASRRDRKWRGITPVPRLRKLALSEFKVDVVHEALAELADRMGHELEPAELNEHAVLVHGASEGLPALLVRYLGWVEQQQWTDLGRLADQDRFDQLARPYIEDELLSAHSLLGHSGDLTDERRVAIEQALKALVPYRLFTQSHLRNHATDGTLRQAREALGWPVERLWAAVTQTDLLYRPQGETWRVIPAPLRRLLVRYWYPDEVLRRWAHRDAGAFVRSLAAERLGKDQAVLLVECLFHEAHALAGQLPDDVRRRLVALARLLTDGLMESAAFTQDDLRELAAELMAEDRELAEALSGVDGLLEELRDVVAPADGNAA